MQHDARSTMMAEEQIPKILTKFAIPAIVSMLIAAMYNVVDTLFVGRIGTEAIGATSISFPLFMLNIISNKTTDFKFGICERLLFFISRKPRNNLTEIRRLFKSCDQYGHISRA